MTFNESSKKEIVVVGNRSLTLNSTGLIKRGLELIDLKYGKRIKVLLATGKEQYFDALLKRIIEDCGTKYEFDFMSVLTGDEILTLVEKEQFDVFVLIVNNILFNRLNPTQNRFIKALKLITQLKTTCNKSVIAFSPISLGLIEQATLAGADYSLRLPSATEDIKSAFSKCFERLDCESRPSSLRILIVDDHTVVRDGIKNMLLNTGIHVVGEAADGKEALKIAVDLSPDVLITNIKMSGINGIQLTSLVNKQCPSCKVIVLTLLNEYLSQVLKAGAKGYLLKDITKEDLVRSIRLVHHGQVVIGKGIEY